MVSHSRSDRLPATGAAALAEFVGAIAFIALGGFFVSFMNGNTKRSRSTGLPGRGVVPQC